MNFFQSYYNSKLTGWLYRHSVTLCPPRYNDTPEAVTLCIMVSRNDTQEVTDPANLNL